MHKDTLTAYNELSKDATSVDDLATLREMALVDEGQSPENGNTTIEVVDENGEVEKIDVKTIGAGALKNVQRGEITIAEASQDWHNPEDK